MKEATSRQISDWSLLLFTGLPTNALTTIESLSSSINKDKKSVVLSYGQRLCDFGQRLLEAEPCYLPLKTKFKFSEKLSSVKSEVSAILSNQTKDGTRLTRYSHELVNLLK